MYSYKQLSDRALLEMLVLKEQDYTQEAINVVRHELADRGYSVDDSYELRKAFFKENEVRYTCSNCDEDMIVGGEELYYSKTQCPSCEREQSIDFSKVQCEQGSLARGEHLIHKSSTEKIIGASGTAGVFLFLTLFKDVEPTGIIGGALKGGLGAGLFSGIAWVILRLKDVSHQKDFLTGLRDHAAVVREAMRSKLQYPEGNPKHGASQASLGQREPVVLCVGCQKQLEPEYVYCPYCGYSRPHPNFRPEGTNTRPDRPPGSLRQMESGDRTSQQLIQSEPQQDGPVLAKLTPSGLDGWLTLVAINLIVGVALSFYYLSEALTEGAVFWTAICVTEVAMLIFLIYLFVNKKAVFPNVYVAFRWIEVVLMAAVVSEIYSAELLQQLLVNAVLTIIWTAYFKVSKRVKNTFVQSLIQRA